MKRPAFLILFLLSNATALFAQDRWSGILQLLETQQPKSAPAGVVAAAAAVPEGPRFTRSKDGYLESIGAAPGFEFPTAGPAGQPVAVATNFILQHRSQFGITSSNTNFRLKRRNSRPGRHSIRLTQTYAGIPVFGGEAVVQVNDSGGVEYVSTSIDRNTAALDQNQVSIAPTLSTNEAIAAARAHYAPEAQGRTLNVMQPELNLFIPSLLKLAGPKRLTWKMKVHSADGMALAQEVFIDAHSGEFVQEIPLRVHALSRVINDSNNTTNYPGTTVRTEGQPATGTNDVDAAYNLLADVYNFYFSRFGRDGIKDDGSNLLATVRYCDGSCPYQNAVWSGGRMVFGLGYVLDDVTGHEMTHGVTEAESGLIYLNEPGAINESLSDVFGEFIDLVNSTGNDSNSVRWQMGEDLPNGALRSMSNPPAFNDPDWLGSPNYIPPVTSGTLANDYGGVHYNSGVNNKLCYLLTDGDTFRSNSVAGMGIEMVAALYYEANVNLLMSSSGWFDLKNALKQAAINLGWSASERQNLDAALVAVALSFPEIYVDENGSTLCVPTGDPVCEGLGDGGPALSIATGVALMPTNPNGTLNGTLFLRGTGHSTRISKALRIQSWDGPARIEAP